MIYDMYVDESQEDAGIDWYDKPTGTKLSECTSLWFEGWSIWKNQLQSDTVMWMSSGN